MLRFHMKVMLAKKACENYGYTGEFAKQFMYYYVYDSLPVYTSGL